MNSGRYNLEDLKKDSATLILETLRSQVHHRRERNDLSDSKTHRIEKDRILGSRSLNRM